MSEQTRDYSNTGVTSGSGRNWVKLVAKEAKFIMPQDAGEGNQFKAYFEKLSMEWKPAVDDLPNRWNINLECKAMLNGKEADVILPLSSHWDNPILQRVINGIYGELSAGGWDRFMRLWLSKKQPVGKREYCTCYQYRSNNSKDYLRDAFVYDETTGKTIGVPEGKEEARRFWLAVCKEIAAMTGGTVVGEDKDPIAPVAGATKSQPAQQTAATTKNPTNYSVPADKKPLYEKAVNSALTKKVIGPTTGDFCAQATEIYKSFPATELTNPATYGTDEQFLADVIRKFLSAKLPDKAVTFSDGVFSTVTPDDDLPF